MLKKFKEKWLKFLGTIAEQNRATYGEGGLSCCELKDANETKKQTTK